METNYLLIGLTSPKIDSGKTAEFVNKEITASSLKEAMKKGIEGVVDVFYWWRLIEINTGQIVAQNSTQKGKILVRKEVESGASQAKH